MVKFLQVGKWRYLSPDEKNGLKNTAGCDFKLVVTHPYIFTDHKKKLTIVVPIGFLSDGDSGTGINKGASWIIHDMLYATHRYENNCDYIVSRKEADEIMAAILLYERRFFYWIAFKIGLCLFRRQLENAWDNSGMRGVCLLV